MTYNLILKFFFKISLIYILKSFLILFHTSHISYKFSGVFDNRFRLIYCLNILFCNFVIISDVEYLSCFFFEKDLFVKKPLYFRIDNS